MIKKPTRGLLQSPLSTFILTDKEKQTNSILNKKNYLLQLILINQLIKSSNKRA